MSLPSSGVGASKREKMESIRSEAMIEPDRYEETWLRKEESFVLLFSSKVEAREMTWLCRAWRAMSCGVDGAGAGFSATDSDAIAGRGEAGVDVCADRGCALDTGAACVSCPPKFLVDTD